MTRVRVGAVKGTAVAWRSYAWLSLSLVAVLATAVALLAAGPPGAVGWTALAALLALACALAAAIGVQLERRLSGGPLRLEPRGDCLRITSSLTWLHAWEITATPEDAVTLAIAAGSQSVLEHLSSGGPIVSVPSRDHIVVILRKGRQRLVVPVFARPDDQWINRLADELREAGVAVEHLP